MGTDGAFSTGNINFHARGSKTGKKFRQRQTKPWDRLFGLVHAIVSICVAWWSARESLMLDRGGLRNSVKRRTLSLILFAGIAAMWTTAAMAQSHTIYLSPAFLYNGPLAFSGGIYTPYRTSLSAAWADVQAAADYCTTTSGGTTCYSVQNLHPNTTGPLAYQFDGIWYWQYYDMTICQTPTGSPTTCNLTPDVEPIETGTACPDGSGGGNYNTNGTNELIACAMTIYDVQPPPKNCESCIGNPIYAATGQKLQVETDYSGPSGLNFTRTYRSNNGFFASVLTQGFADNSLPAGTASPACYPAHWTYGSASGFYCFPYISVYPYVNNGVAQYALQTDDGRSIEFTSPNGAVTANGDINEQVTKLTVNGATEWQVQREDDSTELYNAAGSLIQKTLRGGQTFTYTYSTSSTPTNIAPTPGLLLTQSDAFGHTLSWQYNAIGQMSQMTDPAGGIYQYSYDASGNLIGVIYPDGSSKTYWYNESANTGGASLPKALTGITDENGARYATFQYNSAGLAVNTQHAGGVENYTFNYPYTAYTGQNYTATVTDPLGTTRTYNFSEDGLSYNLDTGQTQPAASGSGTVTQSETYDTNGNPASITDYNGNVTSYVYDLTRNLETSRTEASGTAQARTIATTWNGTWRQPALITEPNRTTGFTYDLLGNVLTKTITDTTVTPNVSRTWTYTYDGYGRMLTAKEPRTDVNSTTTYIYYTCTTGYQCGQIQTITNALGQVTTFNTYNAHGQPLTVTDPNGVVTILTSDGRQRRTSRQVGTETTSYSYTPTGLLQQVTLPDSSNVLYTYDAAHRLTDITDGLSNHIHYTLDAMGNRTAENAYDPSNVLHRTHTRVFNALNQLSEEVNAAGTAAVTTTLGYDDNGNQTSIAAPLSRNTSDQYDALNRLTQITDPASGITQLGYDANDNLASVTDPRTLTTNYSHNGFGDVTQQVSPDTGTSNNTYDSGENLKTATDARNAVATYSYDALNRVTQVAYTDQTINFTYDAGTNGKGRLTGASDANHSLSWSYDTLGRATGKGQTIGSVTKSVGYGYTNADLTSMVTPSGQTITYGYTNHRITSIKVGTTTLLGSVTYDPFGPVTGWAWGNSTTASRTYDQDGKVTTINTAADPINFGYDNAFRITGITDTGASANSWALGYDTLDRLTSGSKTGTSYGWTYDADGNRRTQTGTSASTFTPSSTSNRLSSTTGALARTYSYDTAGNTKTYSNLTFSYSNRGRMSSATVGSTTSNYVYSALGQMIKKTVGSTTTLLMYDEEGHLLGEYSSSGALIQETVWMGDIPVATLRPNGSTVSIYYVHTDQLNTPRKVTRPSDNGLMWRWDVDPFGTATSNQNPQSLGTFVFNLRFPGQYYQAETGLSQNYFRDYDPKTGRFTESDPIGLRGGINTYAYAGGDPVSHKDPLGLFVPPPILLPLAALEAAGVAGYGLGTYIYDKNSDRIQDFIAGVIKGPWPEKRQSISDILDEIMGEKKDVPNTSPDIENAGARNGRRNDCINQCLDFLDRADGGAGFRSCVSKCMKNSAPKSCQ
jgi:RHS repeat-associated protein